MKPSYALALLLLISGRTQPGVHDVHIEMYDASAAVARTKGVELMKKGDYEAARQYYDAAICRDPNEWVPYFDRGQWMSTRLAMYQRHESLRHTH